MAQSVQFVRYSESEAARHASYLVVSTFTRSDKKHPVASTIEWRTLSPASVPARRTDGAAEPAAVVRVRMLAEREPLNAEQARTRAQELAERYRIPVVLTVVAESAGSSSPRTPQRTP